MPTEPSSRTRRFALGAIGCLILLLMSPNLTLLCVGTAGGTVWVDTVVAPMIVLAIVFAALGDVPWLACLLLAPLALLAPLDAYYIGRYHNATTPEVIASIFATNPREIREYLGNSLLPLVLCEVAAVAVALAACILSWRAGLRWRQRPRAWILTLAVAVPLIAVVLATALGGGDGNARLKRATDVLGALSTPFQKSFPVGPIAQFANYRRQWAHVREDIAELDAFRFHAHRSVTMPRRQIYVLVIGEASRRDHWQLFGYDRPTNPELSRVHNLVPFPDMLASWPESVTAIPMLITRRPPDANPLTWNEASVLRAMDEAGFDTWWISNQMPIGIFDSMVATYAYEARHMEYVNHTSWTMPGSYDEDVLQPLRNALGASGRDLFIVVHLMGSHQTYDYRYPNAYRQFRPTQSEPIAGSNAIDQARNSYDNSILYTDHILASIIGVLRDSGAVTALWYASDHGEALPTPTCPIIGHGSGTRYEYEVSALFWASDPYIAAFPDRVAALRANAGKRTLSADTFESLIDMANVTFPGRDTSWSLFDPNWHYRPRIINYPSKIDMDQAGFDPNCQIVIPSNG